MREGFDFLIANDDEHEEVFIEIYYENKFVASISQDDGLNNMEIEFPDANVVESLIARKIPLNDFLDLISEAVKTLEK